VFVIILFCLRLDAVYGPSVTSHDPHTCTITNAAAAAAADDDDDDDDNSDDEMKTKMRVQTTPIRAVQQLVTSGHVTRVNAVSRC